MYQAIHGPSRILTQPSPMCGIIQYAKKTAKMTMLPQTFTSIESILAKIHRARQILRPAQLVSAGNTFEASCRRSRTRTA